MKRATSLFFRLVWLPLLLAACAVQERAPVVYTPPPEPEPEAAPVVVSGPSAEVRRRMAIADMLYAARVAYDDNRLMLPAGDNAYDRYRQVLDFDPENEVARRGIRDIALRYVQLAGNAMEIGQFDDAAGLLRRAATIGTAADEVQLARARLEELRKSALDRFTFDPQSVRAQSPEVIARLGEIAHMLIRQEGATFLITARNDAEGRWMYSVMREAVDGQRLRGNIAIGDRPAVQLQLPPS